MFVSKTFCLTAIMQKDYGPAQFAGREDKSFVYWVGVPGGREVVLSQTSRGFLTLRPRKPLGGLKI